MPSPAVTRNSAAVGKKNSAPSASMPFTLLDIQKLISDSEARIISHVNEKFEELSAKICSLEMSVVEIKSVQSLQGADIHQIKEVIAGQQKQIEAFEERERKQNLILSNVPETDVTVGGEVLKDDESKIVSLANLILPPDNKISREDISQATRLGRGGRNPRIIKVKLSSVQCKINILQSCKNLNLEEVRTAYGRIFINKDLSFLRRKEEKRLRAHFKDLKARYPDSDVRLRGGKLLLGSAVRDSVDFRTQLF